MFFGIFDIWQECLLLLLSDFRRVRLCVTPKMAAYQVPPSLGFSRQEHWSGLPFSSPMHESEKWKWSRSVVSNPQRPQGLQPSRLLCPWAFPGKSTGVGCHCLLQTGMSRTSYFSTARAIMFLGRWVLSGHCVSECKFECQHIVRPDKPKR